MKWIGLRNAAGRLKLMRKTEAARDEIDYVISFTIRPEYLHIGEYAIPTGVDPLPPPGEWYINEVDPPTPEHPMCGAPSRSVPVVTPEPMDFCDE